MWGHAGELERFGLWGVLDEVLSVARSLGLQPATNSEVAHLKRLP